MTFIHPLYPETTGSRFEELGASDGFRGYLRGWAEERGKKWRAAGLLAVFARVELLDLPSDEEGGVVIPDKVTHRGPEGQPTDGTIFNVNTVHGVGHFATMLGGEEFFRLDFDPNTIDRPTLKHLRATVKTQALASRQNYVYMQATGSNLLE